MSLHRDSVPTPLRYFLDCLSLLWAFRERGESIRGQKDFREFQPNIRFLHQLKV